ncbi:MAG: hypothetical protein ACW99G_10225 [Candidatus Thorarchaeota archaeon]|jgi:hypothetical protein
MDIKKESKALGFPRIVLECEGFRFVAIGCSASAEEHAQRQWRVKVPSLESTFTVEVIAEQCSTDSLGAKRWAECDFDQAKQACFLQSLQAGFATKKTKVGPSAKAKDHKVPDSLKVK